MDTQRNARLVLKSSDLLINSTINYGTCDQYRSNMTWNNINLRMLLGDMYDEYDYFNLALNTICTSTSTLNAGSSVDDKNCYVKISGLPFVNQSYSTKFNSSGVYTYIATFDYAANTSNTVSTQYFYSNNIATFSKNQDICNITISMSRMIDDTLPQTAQAFPQIAFIFNILGITREKCSQNATRIIKN